MTKEDKQYQHFYLVFDMTEELVVDTRLDYVAAIKLAEDTAKARLGNMIALMEVKQAFQAKATVSKEYLSYPPAEPFLQG